jgi:hypothetical protein
MICSKVMNLIRHGDCNEGVIVSHLGIRFFVTSVIDVYFIVNMIAQYLCYYSIDY